MKCSVVTIRFLGVWRSSFKLRAIAGFLIHCFNVDLEESGVQLVRLSFAAGYSRQLETWWQLVTGVKDGYIRDK